MKHVLAEKSSKSLSLAATLVIDRRPYVFATGTNAEDKRETAKSVTMEEDTTNFIVLDFFIDLVIQGKQK
jgi:hypothetical protein